MTSIPSTTSNQASNMRIHAAASRRWTWVLAISLGLGLSACGAIQDQEFECMGFDEQRTVASDSQQVLKTQRLPQNIDFHVRTDYVLVKSFRAQRLPALPGQGEAQLAFKMQAPKAQIEGNFDPSTGMLSYNESHEVSIDGQAQTTSSTGVYRCETR